MNIYGVNHVLSYNYTVEAKYKGERRLEAKFKYHTMRFKNAGSDNLQSMYIYFSHGKAHKKQS